MLKTLANSFTRVLIRSPDRIRYAYGCIRINGDGGGGIMEYR